jgi:aspartate aminotransferase
MDLSSLRDAVTDLREVVFNGTLHRVQFAGGIPSSTLCLQRGALVTERFRPFRFSRAGVRGLKVSATLSMNERVRELWAQGRDVYHLGFGESRFPVPPRVAEALSANAHQRSYLPALGLPELRETIARFYLRKFDMPISSSQVVVGPGSKSLLYALLMALGEEVILPCPSWVSYAPQAHILGKPVLWVPMLLEHGYQLEIDILRQQMEADKEEWGNPELLIVNSPNNPTGTVMSPAKAQALADFAREEQLMVLSDEIYALVAHGKSPHVSIAHHYPEGTVVLGGLSKHMSLGGWRFGVAILPAGRTGEALRRAIQNIAGSIWSCVAAPVQYAALAAYADDPEIDEFVERCARMHAIRTHYLYEKLVEADVPCVEPGGAFYLYPSFDKWRVALASHGVQTSEDLAAYLLDKYELVTLPGTAFGSSPDDLSLRLSSSYLDAGTDEKANALVEAFAEDPDPERFIASYHPRLREAVARLAEFVGDLERNQQRGLRVIVPPDTEQEPAIRPASREQPRVARE